MRYGEEGITEYSLRQGIAVISDDTQMSLLPRRPALRRDARPSAGGRRTSDTVLSLPGLVPQPDLCAPLPDVHWAESHVSWLLDMPELFSRRARVMPVCRPWRTWSGQHAPPDKESKGCGGVMSRPGGPVVRRRAGDLAAAGAPR
ncbi:MAG: hypothetical protein ACLUEK_07985 [Oscillospiraceae bacterium]